MAHRRGDSDRRFRVPPPGFVVLRESEVIPDGRPDRWTARGALDGRTIVRSGLRSESGATRAAWFAFDDLCVRAHRPEVGNIEELDAAVADALARRFAAHRWADADGPDLKESYSVGLDSWENMQASLLSQVLHDAGSIRRLSKVIDVPRSTISEWVRKHRDRGTWPV